MSLNERLSASCRVVEAVIGGACMVLDHEGAALTTPTGNWSEAGALWVRTAGERALLVAKFAAMPRWLTDVGRHTASLDLSQDGLTLFLAPDVSPPAALAALMHYVEIMIDAHLAIHPADSAQFRIIDDAAIEKIFS